MKARSNFPMQRTYCQRRKGRPTALAFFMAVLHLAVEKLVEVIGREKMAFCTYCQANTRSSIGQQREIGAPKRFLVPGVFGSMFLCL